MNFFRFVGLSFSLSILLIAHPLLAQIQTPQNDAQQSDTVPISEEIVVTAQPTLERKQVRDAIGNVAMRGRQGLIPLARFQAPVCLHVTGLGNAHDNVIRRRIEQNSLDAGHPVGEEDCKVNALMVVTDVPPAFIKALRRSQPRLFNAIVSRKIDSALAKGKPAIHWSSHKVVGPQKQAASQNGSSGDARKGPPIVRGNWPSKISPSHSIKRQNSIIVFDLSGVEGASLNQIADYASMHLMGQPQSNISLRPNTGETILNLFDRGFDQAPSEMTAIDRAYLKGLYAMRPNERATRLENYAVAAYEENSTE